MEKKDLLRFCRYYNGESDSPYNSGRLSLIWAQECRWVEDTMNDSDMELYLDIYIRHDMRTFEQFDNIPITLKAYLYVYFLKGNEMPIKKDFDMFYQLWKNKKVSK